MDDRQKRLLEYAVAALIILALIAIIWLLRKRAAGPDDLTPQQIRDMPTAEQVFTPEQLAAGVAQPEVNARVFAERFGSFSSEADFGNVSDVLPIVTADLRERLNTMAVAARGELRESYYGISTRVIGVERTSESDSQVVLRVLTQREEATGNPGNKQIRNQELVLTMQLVDGQWLVANYAWQE